MNTPRFRLLALFLASFVAGGQLSAANAPVVDPAAAAPVSTFVMPTKPVAKDANGYLQLGFDYLAGYTFTPPVFDPTANPNVKPPTGEEQIPAIVKSWSGQKAMVTGYMIPVKMEKGLVKEFLLMRNTLACCYGAAPALNEWVVVKTPKGIEPIMDVPVSLYGQFKVGAIFDSGYMTSIYELAVERIGAIGTAP